MPGKGNECPALHTIACKNFSNITENCCPETQGFNKAKQTKPARGNELDCTVYLQLVAIQYLNAALAMAVVHGNEVTSLTLSEFIRIRAALSALDRFQKIFIERSR